MGGNQQHQLTTKDYKDPFIAGQMVGMLVIVSFIEKNGGITEDIINKIKLTCAANVEPFFDKPSEDIFLMVDKIVKELQ